MKNKWPTLLQICSLELPLDDVYCRWIKAIKVIVFSLVCVSIKESIGALMCFTTLIKK